MAEKIEMGKPYHGELARIFEGRIDAMVAGDRPHPLLEQRPWPDMIEDLRRGFQARLFRQRENQSR